MATPATRSIVVPLVCVTVSIATALLAQAPAPATKAAPAAATRAARPNLTCVWQAITSAYWDIEPHAAGPSVVRELGAASAIPPGLGIVEGGAIPYRPEALARRKENLANRLKLDP